MDFFKKDNVLYVKLDSDFNYPSVKKIENSIEFENLREVVIDMTNSKLADTEGVRFLYYLKKSGVKITLVNPPSVLFKIFDILKLTEFFKNLKIVKEG